MCIGCHYIFKEGRWSGKRQTFECPYFWLYSSELHKIFSSRVLCGYRMHFKVSAHLHDLYHDFPRFPRIPCSPSMLSRKGFVRENYMRYSYTIFSNCSLYSIGRNKYFGFLFKLLDTFLLHA